MGIEALLYPRWEVKSWIFNKYPELCTELIINKIEAAAKRKEKTSAGEIIARRNPSFIYVDDNIVARAIRIYWRLEKPKVGDKAPFGLKTHSYQALAIATFYIDRHNPFFLLNQATS